MRIVPKHYIIGILGLILSVFIFWVNDQWNNPVSRSLYLSAFTFLFWMGCWLIYFEIRNVWSFRWDSDRIHSKGIQIKSIQIPIMWEHKKNHLQNQQSNNDPEKSSKKIKELYGEWLIGKNNAPDCPIIIFSHGFSDNCHLVRYQLLPLVYAGYNVVAFDNRGTTRSRSAGRKNQFKEIVWDLGDVIEFVQSQLHDPDRPIYLLGTSLGAIATFYQGLRFYKRGVKKIITLATMSDFHHAFPHSPVLFKRKWWVWIRYKFFNVPINPLPEENLILSPLLQFQKILNDDPNRGEFHRWMQNNVFLIHAQNDPIIPFSHFYDLVQGIKINPENLVVLRKGGHNFIKREPLISGIVLGFLKKPYE